MAEIVLGIGASHTTLMNTQWERVAHLERAHHFRDALGVAGELLQRLRVEAVVIVGSNHFRGLWLDLLPAFSIGVGEVISSGEHGTPSGLLPAAPALGQHLCNRLIANEFDVAFSTRITVDHGISHAFQWIVSPIGLPIVPIVINCFAPPLPSLRRARALGDALRAALHAAPMFDRVAVIGTGGLSHCLPFPDWRAPRSTDDEFLVHSWREGRNRWQDFEAQRRAIVVSAQPRLNQEFDEELLRSLERGSLAELAETIGDDELIQRAGNGAAEIRAWQVMAAALDHRPGRILAYSPMPEWLTGMAVAVIEND